MGNSYIPENIQALIDRLESVNTIIGIESIIDMCHQAADYISNMEAFKHEMTLELEMMNKHIVEILGY